MVWHILYACCCCNNTTISILKVEKRRLPHTIWASVRGLDWSIQVCQDWEWSKLKHVCVLGWNIGIWVKILFRRIFSALTLKINFQVWDSVFLRKRRLKKLNVPIWILYSRTTILFCRSCVISFFNHIRWNWYPNLLYLSCLTCFSEHWNIHNGLSTFLSSLPPLVCLCQPFLHKVNNYLEILFQLFLLVIAYRFSRRSTLENKSSQGCASLWKFCYFYEFDCLVFAQNLDCSWCFGHSSIHCHLFHHCHRPN